MTKKELLRNVISMLSSELAVFDFGPNMKEQGFSRKTDAGFFYFYFLIYERTAVKSGHKGFLIEPIVNISITSIEKHFKVVTTNTELKSSWQFVTLGNSIAELKANPDGIHRKWNETLDLHIFEYDDIQPVSNRLLHEFKTFAMNYFVNNNSVEKTDLIFNAFPREYSVHMNNDIWRFLKGTIAAKLTNNPQLDRLVTEYSSLLRERKMPEYCFEEMERLKDLLPLIKA